MASDFVYSLIPSPEVVVTSGLGIRLRPSTKSHKFGLNKPPWRTANASGIPMKTCGIRVSYTFNKMLNRTV